MVLLAAHNVMDGTFSVTDMIMILSGGAAGVRLWYGQVQATKKIETTMDALDIKLGTLTTGHADKLATMEKEIEKAHESAKAFYSDAKRRSTDIRNEFRIEDEKYHKVMNERVDIVKSDLKEDRIKNDGEFKEINTNLAQIKGMLTEMIRNR